MAEQADRSPNGRSDALKDALGDVDPSLLEPRDFGAALGRLLDGEMAEGAERLAQIKALSAPSAEDLIAWRHRWPGIDLDTRRELAEQMLELSEADVTLDFRGLIEALLDDEDAEVRALGVDGLWEATDPHLIERYSRLLAEDPADRVRARAAKALGAFMQRAELGEIRGHRRQIEQALSKLLDIAQDEREDPEARRRALAAAGYREAKGVRGAIEQALGSEDSIVRAGALRAMGNSADPGWEPEILEWLDAAEADLRFEAVRAAGELELRSALAPIINLAQYELDRQVRGEAIWALGEIGGSKAHQVLDRLSEEIDDSDEDLQAILEDAIATCALMEGDLGPGMFELGGEGDDGPELDDLEGLDDWMN